MLQTTRIGAEPSAIAITPDQAPSAAFSVVAAPAGQAASFDGSASSSPVGSIASYHWDFGDGQSATTTTPVTLHVYAQAGAYPNPVMGLEYCPQGKTCTADSDANWMDLER